MPEFNHQRDETGGLLSSLLAFAALVLAVLALITFASYL